ncbi:MAG: hypothetical protein ACYCV4_08885 [Dermatophilaceae bacterium]
MLGGLGDTDRQAFEEHLPTCAMCRDELRRISYCLHCSHRCGRNGPGNGDGRWPRWPWRQ